MSNWISLAIQSRLYQTPPAPGAAAEIGLSADDLRRAASGQRVALADWQVARLAEYYGINQRKKIDEPI